MHALFMTLQRACVALGLAAGSLAVAAPMPFTAHFEGRSDIVGVVDPNGPVVQVQTAAAGAGVLGLFQPESGSYPVAGSSGGGCGVPMTGAMRSLM